MFFSFAKIFREFDLESVYELVINRRENITAQAIAVNRKILDFVKDNFTVPLSNP
jgi:hypothetical protein